MSFVTVNINGRDVCVPKIDVGDNVKINHHSKIKDFKLLSLLKNSSVQKVSRVDYHQHSVYIDGFNKPININDLVEITNKYE